MISYIVVIALTVFWNVNSYQKLDDDSYLKVSEEKVSGYDLNIKVFESKERFSYTLPKKIKLELENKTKYDIKYNFALEDQTNNTWWCPGNCITTVIKEEYVVSPGQVDQKIFHIVNPRDKDFYMYAVKFFIVSDYNFFITMEKSYWCSDDWSKKRTSFSYDVQSLK